MSVILRSIEHRDVPKVVGLFDKLSTEMAAVAFTEMVTEDQIASWIDNESVRVFVAADGDLILAVIRAKRGLGDKSHSATIAIACDESFGGHKYMAQLTHFCSEALKREEVIIVRAYAYSNNSLAIQNLLSSGFTLSGAVRKHHFDTRLNAYVDDLIFYKELE